MTVYQTSGALRDAPQGDGISEPGRDGVAQTVVPQIYGAFKVIGIGLVQGSFTGGSCRTETDWLHVAELPQQSVAFQLRV